MTKFKEMKIRTLTSADSEKVQEALYKLGYRWHPLVVDGGTYKFVDDCYGLHTRDGFIVRTTLDRSWGDSATVFAEGTEEEYVLSPFGTLVPAADYFKQPSTPEKLQEKVYEPLPLQPFKQWLGDRMKLLSEHVAYGLYKDAVSFYARPLDTSITKELHVLNYLMKHYEEGV